MSVEPQEEGNAAERFRRTIASSLVAAVLLGISWVTNAEALQETKTDKGADHTDAHATSTGAGVPAGVIESGSGGVGINVPKFHAAGRLSNALDFRGLTPGMCNPPTAVGAADHGTLVSDVVASGHFGYTGVARASNVHVGWFAGYHAFRTAIDCLGQGPVSLFNNSWGAGANTDGENDYARFVDWYALAKDALIVKSAGNTGNQITIPGDAFNLITVGAVGASLVDRVDYSAYRLRGDVTGDPDGRGKPEIVAPGGEWSSGLLGALFEKGLIENDSFFNMAARIADAGTSYAAPHVTGTSALLVQAGLPLGILRFHLAHKAIILNSARKRFIDSPKDEIPRARDHPATGNQASDCNYLTPSGRLQPRTGSACPAAAGTTREWTPSRWTYDGGVFETFRPLDDELGTGVLDAERALIQHAGGRQFAGLIGPIGWNVDCVHGGSADHVYKTRFVVREGDFITATLVWDRRINEVEAVAGESPDGVVEIGDTYRPHAADLGVLPDFDLKVYREGAMGSILVASSNGLSRGPTAQNVEHLHFPAPSSGVYEIHVEPDPVARGPCLDYGVAWWTTPRGEFGDAPKSYGTLLLDNGPRHLVPNFEVLGSAVSAEADANDPQDPDGRPNLIVGRHGAWLNRSEAADLDKFDDGVTFHPTTYRVGQTGTMDITICAFGPLPRYQCGTADCQIFVNAWIDWNTNGIFEEGAEHVVDPLVHVPQATPSCVTVTRSFPVPSINTGDLWARVRLDYGEDVGRNDPMPLFTSSPTLRLARGEARFGEVEDYFLGSDFGDLADENITPPCVHAHPAGSTSICGVTPTVWKTDLSNDGARHLNFGFEGLGERASREPDADEAPSDQDGSPNLNPCVLHDEPPLGSHLAQCGGVDGFDDGVDFIVLQRATDFIQYKFRARVSSTIASQGFGTAGRYDRNVAAKRLYLNGWMDLANTGAHEPDGVFDRQVFDLTIDPETFGPDGRYTLGETFVDDGLDGVPGTGDFGEGNGRFDWTDLNGNGAHDAGEPSEGFNDTAGIETKTFDSAVFTDAYPQADNFVLFSARRFRLDYGQDVNQPFGPANFGEVEDYHDPEGGGVSEDSDGDGVPNAEDNCAFTVNPKFCTVTGTLCQTDGDCLPGESCAQGDADGDGVGDDCDTDDDNDGIPDASDSCSTVPNPGQEDLDGDGQGDACDPDRDGDGVANTTDNCPDVPNPRLCSSAATPCQINADCPPGEVCHPQQDSDGDGIGDACEADFQACCGVGGPGGCTMSLPVLCTSQGGTPLGAGSSCLGSEACCASGGSCQDLDPRCCAVFGLTPRGPGSECPPSGTCDCVAVPSDPSNLRLSKDGDDVVLGWDVPRPIDRVESWSVYWGDAPDTAMWGAPRIHVAFDVGPTTRDFGAVTESSPIRFYKVTATNACGESPFP